MTVFFTSDTHFGHKFVSELRGFSDVEEMNEALVARWNEKVGPDDTVYHLGDAVMGGFDKNSHHIGRLNGHKTLICGNHDRPFYGLKNYEDKAEKYINAGFDMVFHGKPMDSYVDGVGPVLMCHFPYDHDERHDDRYNKYHPQDRGSWLLHGHVHELWKTKGRQINVGVDVWNGYPVPESVISALIKLGPSSEHHFQPWKAA